MVPLNLPNVLTVVRILLVPVLLALSKSPQFRRVNVAMFAVTAWIVMWLQALILTYAFTMDWPSLAFARTSHANPLLLGLSYLSLGTLYLLSLLAWLLWPNLCKVSYKRAMPVSLRGGGAKPRQGAN